MTRTRKTAESKAAAPQLHRPLPPLQIHARLVRIEVALWGDLEKRERWERAAGTAPRGEQPPDGLIVQLSAAHHDLESRFDALGELLADYGIDQDEPAGPEPSGDEPLDWNHVVTKRYVDKGYARLSAALRNELTGYVERVVKELREEIGGAWKAGDSVVARTVPDRLDALEAGVKELARFIVEVMSKKTTKRIVKLLDRWYFDERGDWILKAIGDYLNVRVRK